MEQKPFDLNSRCVNEFRRLPDQAQPSLCIRANALKDFVHASHGFGVPAHGMGYQP